VTVNISLHIERLILDGLPMTGHDAASVEGSIRQELTRLLTEGGISPALASGGATPSLPAEHIAQPASQAGSLGRQIANATYRSVGGDNR
jgi:hypothetical protein